MKAYRNSSRKLTLYIVLSFLFCVLSNGEWCIPVFAWIYPILFLGMLHLNRTRNIYFIIIGICATSFSLQFHRVIGMDLKICIAAAILLSLLKILPYLYWMKSKMNFQDTLLFAGIMVLIEYIVYLIYPSLGGLSDAYTQYQNLYLLQIVTVTGIYGITFIMYWTAIMAVWIWNNKNERNQIKKYILTYGSVLGVVIIYGIAMVHFADHPEKSVRIAGVTVPVSHLLNDDTDVYSVFYTNTFTDENVRNARKKLAEVKNQLFIKTEQEAQAGAKIVFWSELNGAVLKDDEEELLQEASDIAREQDIYLLIALLVKTPYENLKENKTVLFNPQGEQVSEYYKYGRSIGELCQKGDGELKSLDTEYGKIAPFICSDMAFSYTIRQAGNKETDILMVPSSDWKEMTLLASKTAVVRGVENGCNIIRHTNNGLSIASDTKGTILAQADYFKSDTKTLSAQVFTKGRFTLYSYIGNFFVYLCGIYFLGCLLMRKLVRPHSCSQ